MILSSENCSKSNKLKIMVVDGQGGRIGSALIEKIKQSNIDCHIIAVGTNSVATGSMLKAGANVGATGENPVVVNSINSDVIIGPVGIAFANSLHGEVTPKMAESISGSGVYKILLPVDKCNIHIVGASKFQISDIIDMALDDLISLISKV